MSNEKKTDHLEKPAHSENDHEMGRKYHFMIENTPYEWDQQFITEKEIRAMGPGIPENMDLFLKVSRKTGRLVETDESIDLAAPGIEKFYSQESSSDAGAK